MPFPDGTLTTDEHVRYARECIDATARHTPDVAVVDAINGLAHAVLALVANQEIRRTNGGGW
jgi:hypothetical protein